MLFEMCALFCPIHHWQIYFYHYYGSTTDTIEKRKQPRTKRTHIMQENMHNPWFMMLWGHNTVKKLRSCPTSPVDTTYQCGGGVEFVSVGYQSRRSRNLGQKFFWIALMLNLLKFFPGLKSVFFCLLKWIRHLSIDIIVLLYINLFFCTHVSLIMKTNVRVNRI